jgi:hypothetical protein
MVNVQPPKGTPRCRICPPAACYGGLAAVAHVPYYVYYLGPRYTTYVQGAKKVHTNTIASSPRNIFFSSSGFNVDGLEGVEGRKG